MQTYKRSEPCPTCGNRTFGHRITFPPDATEAVLTPTCLACGWLDKPREERP